ncbi:MAG: flagellar assembly protein FliX [Pseudomonadota bacterium]
MRIHAPQKVSKVTSATIKKRPEGASGFAAAIEDTPAPEQAQANQSVSPLGSLAGILATQSVDPDAERRQSVKNANDVLAALEQVRRGILLGAISVGRLKTLSQNLSERIATTPDPKLQDIMTDIVLRARVELAKAGVYT